MVLKNYTWHDFDTEEKMFKEKQKQEKVGHFCHMKYRLGVERKKGEDSSSRGIESYILGE